jgi:hypothetical protein
MVRFIQFFRCPLIDSGMDVADINTIPSGPDTAQESRFLSC